MIHVDAQASCLNDSRRMLSYGMPTVVGARNRFILNLKIAEILELKLMNFYKLSEFALFTGAT